MIDCYLTYSIEISPTKYRRTWHLYTTFWTSSVYTTRHFTTLISGRPTRHKRKNKENRTKNPGQSGVIVSGFRGCRGIGKSQ